MENRVLIPDEAKILPKGNIGSLEYVYHYLLPYKWPLTFALLAIIITASTIIAVGQGMRFIIDNGFAKADNVLLNKALFGMVGIAILLAISAFARSYLVNYSFEHLARDLRNAIYQKALSLEAKYYDFHKVTDITSRLSSDVSLLTTIISATFSFAIRNGLQLIGGVAMLFITSHKLTIYVMLTIPVIVVAIGLIGRKARKLSKKTQEKISSIASHSEETLSAIKMVRAYGREGDEYLSFFEKSKSACDLAMERIWVRSWLVATIIAALFSSIGFVLWVGGHDVIAGRMTAGELSSFIFYSAIVAGAVGSISEVATDLQRAGGAAERIYDILNDQSEEDYNPQVTLPNCAGKISFEQVGFYYPARSDKQLLSNFDLVINAGEKIALVGQSGAGKSTIFQLLLRFYDPEFGKILIDDINIRDLSLKELRNLFGFVSQEPIIFSASAYENIKYGNKNASDEEIIAAATAACAMEFLQLLPDGIHSYLGERGANLSGGQKQRIAIARAIIKNPRILLLDEATSALDAKNERMVQESMDKLMQNRTNIIIAHRFATIKKCDRIVVMEDGKILEIGTHDDLLMSNQLYSKLAKLQFQS